MVSGDYHFVTSSPALVARFLQTAKGEGSLGNSREFRHARSVLPIDRNDAVFVYFSDAFFRNFTSPAYRIESLRRLEAATDIEIVQLAKLNAATEGKPGGTIEELIDGGFLPPGFGPRSDGSQAVIGKGEVYDSLRGRRGSFVPVPDVPVRASQPGGGRFLRPLRGLRPGELGPGRADPRRLAAQVAPRQARAGGDRRPHDAACNASGSRCSPRSSARSPTTSSPPCRGTWARFEASLPNQRMFGGLRDVAPPNELIDGRFMPWLKLRNAIVGYLGYQGDPGFLRLLELMFGGPQDANGYKRSVIGLWRLQYGTFALFSFQPEVLAEVAPQLRFEPARQPAQLRLHVNDVSAARIAPFLNNWGYARTRETALGNIRLMHSLNQQLHVPVKDCREAAEFLLAAKLVCPLGGQYVVRDAARRREPLDLDQAGGIPAQGRLRARGPAGLRRPAAELVPRARPARLAGRYAAGRARRGRHAVARQVVEVRLSPERCS